MEKNEVIDNEDVIDDVYYDDETELTVDDYKKERLRREKAEKTLVELKKQLKEKEKQKETVLDDKELDLREELNDFLADNKDLKEYKADLMKYRKQGFTIKQAVALVENDDKTIENRRKANLNVSDWEWTGKTVYTYDELEKMSQSDYNKVKELQLKWKVKFKN